jgi:small neutral amino acid transporter SnatA (MarC family)
MEPVEDARLAEYERGFHRAGLPLFIAERSAATDIFNRAAPLIGLVFFAEVLGALNLDWSPWANVAAVGGSLALLLAGFATLNRSRGRPAVAIPEDVRLPELAGFVLIPAALPLIFGGQWLSALVTGVGNLVLLGLIYAVIGLGLFSIVRWTMGRMAGQLRASLELFARAIPLLMIFSVVLFLTAEVWQVFASVELAALAILTGLFVLLGTSFLVARLPREVRTLEREADTSAPPLDRRERLNVGLVMFVSQALQVLVVSLSIGGFFVAVGVLAVDPEITKSWTGDVLHPLIEMDLFGHEAVLSEELLRVAGAIAAFTGLYFAISMLTDDVYRREFLEELTAEMRESLCERAEYLRLRSAPDSPSAN